MFNGAGWSAVVTRPGHEATTWVAALQNAGHRAQALPLMAFGPPPDPAALARCVTELHRYHAVMFVSPQAVESFWHEFLCKQSSNNQYSQAKAALISDFFTPGQTGLATPTVRAGNPLRCWAPGPGTARALVAAGVPVACIDQPPPSALQFDSEALWAIVGPGLRPGQRLLVVRGHVDAHGNPDEAVAPTGQGREWLAERCRAAGAEVAYCVAYSRGCPPWSADERQRAQAATGPGVVWLFTSTEGLGHLGRLMPGHDWSGTHALATHPRIAVAAQALGFGAVHASRPALADVLAVLAQVPPQTLARAPKDAY